MRTETGVAVVAVSDPRVATSCVVADVHDVFVARMVDHVAVAAIRVAVAAGGGHAAVGTVVRASDVRAVSVASSVVGEVETLRVADVVRPHAAVARIPAVDRRHVVVADAAVAVWAVLLGGSERPIR